MASLGELFALVPLLFPMVFVNQWTMDRVFTYFSGTYRGGMKGFTTLMFHDKGESCPEVVEGYSKNVWRFFDKTDVKFYTLRLHIALSVVLVVLSQHQLLPFVRRTNMSRHRTLGWLFIAVALPFWAEQVYTLLVEGMVNMGQALVVGNLIAVVTMAVATPLGVWFARRHDVTRHRACMLLCAAALYINPAQRFLWVILSQSQYKAPWASLQAWLDGPAAVSEVGAVLGNFAVATTFIAIGASRNDLANARGTSTATATPAAAAAKPKPPIKTE